MGDQTVLGQEACSALNLTDLAPISSGQNKPSSDPVPVTLASGELDAQPPIAVAPISKKHWLLVVVGDEHVQESIAIYVTNGQSAGASGVAGWK